MLTSMIPFLDKHLALGLLNFYADRGLDVTDAMSEIMSKTALLEDGTVRPEHEEKLHETAIKAKPALEEFFEASESEDYTYQFKLTGSEVEQLRLQGELSHEYLNEKKNVSRAVMTAVLELAFLYYDKGSYGDASELLTLCQCVSGYDMPADTLLWGKLMCDTGACNWQSAIEVAGRIRSNQNSEEDEIFRRASVTTVRARAWLLHWVLFPFFKGGNQYPINLLYYIFDYRNEYIYQRVVETVCPHYLRYIAAAALLNPSRHLNLRSAAAMAQRLTSYSDPITQLLVLIHKYAFEEALAILPVVQSAIQGDYFLCDFEEDLLSKAKRMIFQRYMALHTIVSIPYVAEKLDVSLSEAEVWLVNLISESKQRAKVDSVNEQLNVEPQTRAIETIVLDKVESASRTK